MDRIAQGESAPISPTTKREAKRSVSHNVKRNSGLAEIYKQINAAYKVNTGSTKKWDIDYKNTRYYGASACIGCSAVIVVNGKQLLLGHYAELTGPSGDKTVEKVSLTKKYIIEPMSAQLDLFDGSDDVHAWLIHSSRNTQPAGLDPWKDGVLESLCEWNIPRGNLQGRRYLPSRVPGGGMETFDNSAEGKMVVITTPQPGGGVEIAVYKGEETAFWWNRYRADKTPDPNPAPSPAPNPAPNPSPNPSPNPVPNPVPSPV